jgi:sulfoxide reductase heme-binding subunit YedZ
LNLPDLIRFRRMLGLFAFSYLLLHFLTYLLLDQSFDFAAISKDIAKRPFITVGFLGFLLLVPMAITSTAGWIRRLGGRRWQMIHRGIYLAAICGVIHYYWKVKSDVRMPLFYGVLVAILLLWRLGDWFFKRRSLAGAKLSGQHAPANPSELTRFSS